MTLGIPGTGLSYRTAASTQLVILAVVVVAIVGIAYLIQPELVKGGAALVAAQLVLSAG